jgi:hypothetical protein
MNKRVRVAAVAAFMSVSVLTIQPAQAGSVAGNGGATEATQILNNAELALQTISEEMTFIQTEINTYYSMLQQMPIGIGEFSTTLGEIQGKYQSAMGMYSKLQGLYGSVTNMKDYSLARVQAFAATGLDWRSYVAREQGMAQARNARNGMITEAEMQSFEAVKKYNDALVQYQGEIGSTTGTHGAVTVLNGQMNTMISQMNQVIEQAGRRNLNEAAYRQEDDGEAARKFKMSNEFAEKYNQSIFDTFKPSSK